MKNKKGFEFGFTWIFVILVGAVILFAAIYATTRLVDTSRIESDTYVSTELNNLLHPIETNLEESKFAKVEFVQNTRVYNDCFVTGTFGKQQISTSSKSGIGDEWGRKSIRKSSFNKYIFSREYEEGEKLNVIVKPFEMPFKIGDLTILYSGGYCFVDPSSEIEDDLDDFSLNGQKDIGIEVVNDIEDCSKGNEIVCFDQIGCDINVVSGNDVVIKDEKELFYEGNLLYGAIFSDPEIYECQLKRLMKRAGELANLYAVKTEYLAGKGCGSNLENDLRDYVLTTDIVDSKDFLRDVVPLAKIMEDKNEVISTCKAF
jgi:hypothetical protein